MITLSSFNRYFGNNPLQTLLKLEMKVLKMQKLNYKKDKKC